MNENLRSRLAVITPTNSKIVNIKVATECSRSKGDISFLWGLKNCLRQSFTISKMKVIGFHFLVQNPCVGRTCIKQGANFLRRCSNINIRYVRHIKMIIKMKSQSSTSLFIIFVQFALTHMPFLTQALYSFTSALG